MITPIHVHIEAVRDQLTNLMSHLSEFPTPEEVKEHDGAVTGPAVGFGDDLERTVGVAAQATQVMLEELVAAEEVIRAALKDLAEHDEEMSDNAERLESFVDNAVAQVSGEDGAADGGSQTSTGGVAKPLNLY